MAWTVEWKQPPASAFLSERDQMVEDLKAQPGRWARVKKDMKSKTGIGVWKKAGLEAVTAPAESDPALFDYYARAPETPAAAVTAAPPAPAKAKKAPLVTQRVAKARDLPASSLVPEVAPDATGDVEAQARIKSQLASRLGHRRG